VTAEASPLHNTFGQPEPDDGPEPRFIYAVGALDRIIRRRLATILQPFSVTVAEYTTLSLVKRRDGYSNADLSKRAFVSPQAMNEVIRSLEERRLLARTPSTTHGSVLNTYLTASGRDLLGRCDTAVDRLEQAMLEGVPAGASTDVMPLLLQCARNLRRSTSDTPAPE
jgi:DNA-binding MarR family transcriptional regulator